MMQYVVRRVGVVFVALVLACPILLRASDLSLQLGYAFSGTSPAATNGPWLNALFEQAGPGTVRLTVSNLNLAGSENVDELYINLNPNLDPASLSFAFGAGSGAFDQPAVSTGVNQFKADGDGKYDVLFSFATAGSDANRFNQADSMVVLISGIATLNPADFACLSAPAGGSGPFYAAAHVQRIGPDSLSGWVAATSVQSVVPVPEPRPAALFLASAGLWLFLSARRQAARLQAQRLQPIPLQRNPHNVRPLSRRQGT